MQRINVYIDFLFLTLSLRKVSTGNCETLLEIPILEWETGHHNLIRV